MLKNFVRWIFIPTILLLISIFLSIIYFFNSDINPNILSYNHKSNSVWNINRSINGKFIAQDDYLGIITVRLNKKDQLSGDSVFRIKNVLDDNWYHTATISAKQYDTLPFYSFGFPVIEKSKNKVYQFEVKLFSKNERLTVNKQNPVLVSNYVYPKQILTENPSLLINFVHKKISYYIYNPNFWKILFIYCLPLLIYFFYITYIFRIIPKKYKIKFIIILNSFSKPTVILVYFMILIDIFIIRKYSNTLTTILTILWILSVIAYRFEEKFSFGTVLIFLTFCPFLLSTNMEQAAEKSAIWAYMMLVVGTTQSIIRLSPIFKKISQSKIILFFISKIKFAILNFDYLIINLLNYFLRSIINLLIFIFKKVPITFYEWVIFIGKLILMIILFIIIFFIFIFTVIKINNYIQIVNHKKIRFSMNPYIETIEPKLVYKGTKIIIYGNGFGCDTKKSQILFDGKTIETVLCTDTKIILLTPLHWINGFHKIRIEKTIDWNGKKEVAKSNDFEIKVLPVNTVFSEDDDLYFEQMKMWRPETRKINGYE